MFLRLFVVLSVATTMSSAFTVPFHSNSNGFVAFGRQQQQRTTFASSVHMSDETATEPAASDAVAAVEAPASSSEPELTAEETAAKRKIQRERHTLFVGNLPFGGYFLSMTQSVHPYSVFLFVCLARCCLWVYCCRICSIHLC